MGMGMETLPSFALTWVAMTAAMMTPSTLPFVVSFARRLPRWPLATAVLVAVYLLVWSGFGIAVYFASMAIPISIPAATAAALAIAFVGLYALTPVMRLGRRRCIEMCRRTERIDGLGVRAAIVEGITYGVGCVACSAGVMMAVVVLGMSNLVWIAAGAAMVLLYKLAGRWTRRIEPVASVVCVVAAAWLLIGGVSL
jgi:predicted metal-binding membrane protein